LLTTLEIRVQLGYNPRLGGVSEWPMEAVLKTARGCASLCFSASDDLILYLECPLFSPFCAP